MAVGGDVAAGRRERQRPVRQAQGAGDRRRRGIVGDDREAAATMALSPARALVKVAAGAAARKVKGIALEAIRAERDPNQPSA